MAEDMPFKSLCQKGETSPVGPNAMWNPPLTDGVKGIDVHARLCRVFASIWRVRSHLAPLCICSKEENVTSAKDGSLSSPPLGPALTRAQNPLLKT